MRRAGPGARPEVGRAAAPPLRVPERARRVDPAERHLAGQGGLAPRVRGRGARSGGGSSRSRHATCSNSRERSGCTAYDCEFVAAGAATRRATRHQRPPGPRRLSRRPPSPPRPSSRTERGPGPFAAPLPACYIPLAGAVRTNASELVSAEESPGTTGQGAGQRPAGVTRGKVPQRTDRRTAPRGVRGKGETVR